MALPFPPDDARLAALRAELPALGAGIYLDTATAGPLPTPAAEAMAELAGWELRTGRATADYADALLDRMDEARAAVAAVVTADLDQIAITSSTSTALAIAAQAVDWQAGDRAIAIAGREGSGLDPLADLRERRGIHIDLVDLDQPDEAALIEAFDRAVAPATRLVAVPHVSPTRGVVLPVSAIAEIAHDRGALLVVDGSHAVGAIAVDVSSLGADVYVIAGHTWLLGPEGIAALWADPAALDRLRVASPGASAAVAGGKDDGAAPRRDGHRLDALDLYKPAIVGLGRSVGWLSMTVGLSAAHERATDLARSTAARLAAIEGLSILTPVDRMATIVTFRLEGWPARTALDELGARVFALATAMPELDAIRISLGWFNDAAELERFAGAVELLAAHTPETIPRRARLELLGGGR